MFKSSRRRTNILIAENSTNTIHNIITNEVYKFILIIVKITIFKSNIPAKIKETKIDIINKVISKANTKAPIDFVEQDDLSSKSDTIKSKSSSESEDEIQDSKTASKFKLQIILGRNNFTRFKETEIRIVNMDQKSNDNGSLSVFNGGSIMINSMAKSISEPPKKQNN